MDYINIGAIGFAQFGSDDYYNKRLIEKKVIMDFLETDVFKIPENLKSICFFEIKKFPYEHGSYEEVVLRYDDKTIDKWDDEYQDAYDNLNIDDAESDEAYELLKTLPNNKSDEFWDFANNAERIDFETEELMEKCNALWVKEKSMTIAYKRKDDDLDDNLKIAK